MAGHIIGAVGEHPRRRLFCDLCRRARDGGRMSRKWGHDELQHDLAEYLRGKSDTMAWENMQIGPSGSPRPDVYEIGKTFTRFCPRTYEIKVSVSDFRSDVTSGKWQSYLRFSGAVIFATPAGLISKADVPNGCGLIQRSDAGWRMAKAPTLQKIETLDRDAWLKLLMGGIEREVKRTAVTARSSSKWLTEARLRKSHGDETAKLISQAIRSRASVEEAIDQLEKQREEIRLETSRELKWAIEAANSRSERLSSAQQDLAAALGLPRDTTPQLLISAMREAANRLSEDAEIERLRRAFKQIESALADGLRPLPALAP